MSPTRGAAQPPGPEFSALAETFAGCEDVLLPGGGGRRHFGCDALRVNGFIFAMEVTGRLVLKLPARRVAALIADGVGAPFGTTPERPMREWVSLPADTPQAEELAREAYVFLGGSARR